MKFKIILLCIFLCAQVNGVWSTPTYRTNITIENTDSDDEFEDFNDTEEGEGTEDSDEFEEFDESNENVEHSKEEKTSCTLSNSCTKSCDNNKAPLDKAVIWVLGILGFTVLAGIFVRFEFTRKFRNIFLLISLIVLGFSELHHACPCMLSSFQNTLLWFYGNDVSWSKMLWFLGLIPITYIFGQVWCGWVCHLGGLQEFLYLPGKVKILKSEKAQRILKLIRIALFAALIIQLFVTSKLFFCKIDPFKTVFDLGFLGNHYIITRWILLGLLLISSLFTYRPFCKAICPVGLMLGLVSKIPGASILGIKNKCVGCNSCNKACEMDAITHHGKHSTLDNKDCIACGACFDSCKKNSLAFVRKNKKNPVKIECKNECNI